MKKSKQTNKSLGERFKRKAKALLTLFWSMFKIGLFTFGGGYAMIHLLENEFVAKKKWLDNDEFFDLITIAESTPGPVAINSSTYIGYKTEGFIGSLIATTAMCLPSFIIIFCISLFFNAFLENKYVNAAFQGIQVCAVFLIMCAGIKMAKKIKFTPFNIVIFAATFIAMVLVSIFGAKFSSIFYILISGCIGLFIYSTKYFNDKLKAKKLAKENITTDGTSAENSNDAENALSSEINQDTVTDSVIIDESLEEDKSTIPAIDVTQSNESLDEDISTIPAIDDNQSDSTLPVCSDNIKQVDSSDDIEQNDTDTATDGEDEGGSKWYILNYFWIF